MTDAAAWQQRREGGASFMLHFIRFVALRMSPRVARGMLYPITLYYLIMRGAERRASRHYLRRVLDREPTLWHIARHIHCFAASILDRVFLLSGRFDSRRVRVHGLQEVNAHLQAGTGLMLLGTHFGSFDAARSISFVRSDIEVRILMDFQHNAKLSQIINALHPKAQETIIDAGQDGTQVLLKMHETIASGNVVGILADRARGHEPTVTATLLGGAVQLPVSPLRIAALLNCPVMLVFGIRQQDGSYDIHFEAFAERLDLGTRSERATHLAHHAQRLATRLEARVRKNPYNWFNFYEFWS